MQIASKSSALAMRRQASTRPDARVQIHAMASTVLSINSVGQVINAVPSRLTGAVSDDEYK